jgi:hypothetical protein
MTYRAEIHGAAIHEVDETPRSCDQDVGAARQKGDLLADGLAADHRGHGQFRASGERAEVVSDLVGQLARRRQDQCLGGLRRGPPGLGEKLVDQRQTERQRLAGAGLGEAEDVMPHQRQRDGLVLDRGRLGETGALQRVIEGRREAEHIEIEHVFILCGPPEPKATARPIQSRASEAAVRVCATPGICRRIVASETLRDGELKYLCADGPVGAGLLTRQRSVP